jgi:hypothetical protein
MTAHDMYPIRSGDADGLPRLRRHQTGENPTLPLRRGGRQAIALVAYPGEHALRTEFAEVVAGDTNGGEILRGRNAYATHKINRFCLQELGVTSGWFGRPIRRFGGFRIGSTEIGEQERLREFITLMLAGEPAPIV